MSTNFIDSTGHHALRCEQFVTPAVRSPPPVPPSWRCRSPPLPSAAHHPPSSSSFLCMRSMAAGRSSAGSAATFLAWGILSFPALPALGFPARLVQFSWRHSHSEDWHRAVQQLCRAPSLLQLVEFFPQAEVSILRYLWLVAFLPQRRVTSPALVRGRHVDSGLGFVAQVDWRQSRQWQPHVWGSLQHQPSVVPRCSTISAYQKHSPQTNHPTVIRSISVPLCVVTCVSIFRSRFHNSLLRGHFFPAVFFSA